MQCVFSPEVSYNNGVFTAPAVGEASAEYRRGCDVLFFLGFSGYWPAGEAPGEGEERLVLDELAVEVAERHGVPVAEVTGAALPPPSRRPQEAAQDEEALDEEEREDRYMSAALGVFLDYRDSWNAISRALSCSLDMSCRHRRAQAS